MKNKNIVKEKYCPGSIFFYPLMFHNQFDLNEKKELDLRGKDIRLRHKHRQSSVKTTKEPLNV